MQDNVNIHTAKKVKQFFKENAIPLLDWAPYSLDINLIKHVWAKMKEWIVKYYPELSTIKKSEAAYDLLAKAIVEAWDTIPQEYLNKLI
jgi:transposase